MVLIPSKTNHSQSVLKRGYNLHRCTDNTPGNTVPLNKIWCNKVVMENLFHLQYDLRVYALVTCVNPLRVYLYEEGLVRFASEPFTLHRSKLRYLAHLLL